MRRHEPSALLAVAQHTYRFAGGKAEFPHEGERIVEGNPFLRASTSRILPEPTNDVIHGGKPFFRCAVCDDHSNAHSVRTAGWAASDS